MSDVTIAIIGVGSNLGSRLELIEQAAALLAARPHVEFIERAPVYESDPLQEPQPKYLNTAFRVCTSLGAQALLECLQQVEAELGRLRTPGQRWASRTMDLDLLWYGGEKIETEGLIVPHRELETRAFALVPLLDVAPELRSHYQGALERLPRARLRPYRTFSDDSA